MAPVPALLRNLSHLLPWSETYLDAWGKIFKWTVEPVLWVWGWLQVTGPALTLSNVVFMAFNVSCQEVWCWATVLVLFLNSPSLWSLVKMSSSILFPGTPASSALCLHASPFFTQVTVWAPNLFMGGHSSYMTIKGSLEEEMGPILKKFNLLTPKRLWREKVCLLMCLRTLGNRGGRHCKTFFYYEMFQETHGE